MESKTYFIISDIHSFYNEMIKALKEAGYNKKDKNHILVILGDLWDRGPDAIKVFKFIKSIPKNRRILVRGNHEDLYKALLCKRFPHSHDFSNRTVDTFCQIYNDTVDIYEDYITADELEYQYDYAFGDFDRLDAEAKQKWRKVLNAVSESPVSSFILDDSNWVDHAEIDRYVFVHSFIPVRNQTGLDNEYGSYFKTWRTEATSKELAESRWGCPWKQYKMGLFKQEENNGKILVCGHWHTSDFYYYLDFDKRFNNSCAPIYYGKGIIGIDGGCMYNRFEDEYIHPQNVLVINEDYEIVSQKRNLITESRSDDKIDYRLDIGKVIFDDVLCCSNCNTKCARKKMPEGICTVSDLSKVCKSYKKRK